MIEGDELDAVQQPSPVESAEQEPAQAQDAVAQAEAPVAGQEPQADEAKPHPLEPEGDRFKQVWARAKAAEERAKQVELEARQEREERIRLEERLKAQEQVKQQVQPKYSWDQLQAAVDNGTITFAKALEIRDAQLYEEWDRKQVEREEKSRVLSSVSTEMEEYKKLVPKAVLPGTEERQKVEREFGYLVQRLGRPQTKEQELSMELAAARAAFGDLDSLRTKQQLAAKPVGREPYMDTSSAQKKASQEKKDFRSTLSQREVQHYERMMRQGRYPGGWADVQKEQEEYDSFKKTGVV